MLCLASNVSVFSIKEMWFQTEGSGQSPEPAKRIIKEGGLFVESAFGFDREIGMTKRVDD
jgi:hypothetical protein